MFYIARSPFQKTLYGQHPLQRKRHPQDRQTHGSQSGGQSRIRTLRKKVLAAIESGDAAAATSSLSEFASASDKAAKTKVLHKHTSARLKSRLAQKINGLAKKA